MNRRSLMNLLSGAAVTAAVARKEAAAAQQAAQAARGVKTPIIKDIQVIATAPAGLRLAVVKILTDQDGLYGYGCATFTQRADLVTVAVEKYLKPLLIGRPADRIDDTWQLCYNSSYWRNGPVLNNAISGVDMALWDIKGRQVGLPVYQLLGGKVREAADVYRHAAGADFPQVIDQVRQFLAQGVRYVRVQVGVPGQSGYGAGRARGAQAPPPNPATLHREPMFEPASYIRRALRLFEECRKQLGEEVELLHDVHERVSTTQAVQFAKDVEKFNLFFLEDPLSPEDIQWFRHIRQQCTTPIAMGELFNSPHEWNPLISERLIDYIRVHVSQAGGLTPCRKMAILGELFGVRTAWHGPGDVSPIGHACNATLDVVAYNFGVQEYSGFSDPVREVFSGCPEVRNGYVYVNEAPGWGIEVNEAAAKKYPFGHGEGGERGRYNGGWGVIRKQDGTVIKQ